MKNSKDLTKEIYELVGENFPLSISIELGKVVDVKYSKEWREGGTIPTPREDGSIEYVEDYTDKKLTEKQVETIDNWIKENLDS